MDSRLSTFSKEIENIISNKLINLQQPRYMRAETNGSIFQDFEKKISMIGTNGHSLKGKMDDLSRQLDMLHKQNQQLISDQKLMSSQVKDKEAKTHARKQSGLSEALSPIHLERSESQEQMMIRSGTITLGPCSEHPTEGKFKFENTETELEDNKKIITWSQERNDAVESGEKRGQAMTAKDKEKHTRRVEFGSQEQSFEIKKVKMNSRKRRRKSILKNSNMNQEELKIIRTELNHCATIEDTLEQTRDNENLIDPIKVRVKSCSSSERESKQKLNEGELENRLIQENLQPSKRARKRGRNFSETLNNIYSDFGKTLDQIELDKLITNVDSQKKFDFKFDNFNITEMMGSENKHEDERQSETGLGEDTQAQIKVVKSEELGRDTGDPARRAKLSQSTANHLQVPARRKRPKQEESPKRSAQSFKSSMSEEEEEERLSVQLLSKFISPGSKRYVNKKLRESRFIVSTKKRERMRNDRERIKEELTTPQKSPHVPGTLRNPRFSFYPKLAEGKLSDSDILVTNSNLRPFWGEQRVMGSLPNPEMEEDIPFKSERQIRCISRTSEKSPSWSAARTNRFSWAKFQTAQTKRTFSENQLIDNSLCKLFMKIIVYQSKLESLKLKLHEASGESLLFGLFRHFSFHSGQFDRQSLGQLCSFLKVSLSERQIQRIWAFVTGFECVPEIFKMAPGLKYNLGQQVPFRQFRLLFGSHRLSVPESFLKVKISNENGLCSPSEQAMLGAILGLTSKMLNHISFLVGKLQTFDMEHLFHVLEQFESPFDNKSEMAQARDANWENCHSRDSSHFKSRRNQQICSNAPTDCTLAQNAPRTFCPNQAESHWNRPQALQELDLNASAFQRGRVYKSSQSLLTNVRGESCYWGNR